MPKSTYVVPAAQPPGGDATARDLRTPVGENPGGDWAAARTAAAFTAAVESGRLDLPQPGGGRTGERWAVLADLATEDLSLARLAEGHADALAILAELGAAGLRPAGAGVSGPRSRPVRGWWPARPATVPGAWTGSSGTAQARVAAPTRW